MPTLLFIDDNPTSHHDLLKIELEQNYQYKSVEQIPTNQEDGIQTIDKLLNDPELKPKDLIVLVDHNCPNAKNGEAIMKYALEKGAGVLALSGTSGPAEGLPQGVIDAYGLYDHASLHDKIEQALLQSKAMHAQDQN